MSGSSIFATVRKRSDLGAILIATVLFILYALADPGGFFTWYTIKNIVQFSAILAFVAIGQTLLLIAREIDLSVGSVYGLAGIGLILIEREVGVVPAVALVLLGAAAIGFIHAVLVLRAGLPSMIVTLCGLFFYRGLIYFWSGGSIPSLARAARSNWLVQTLGGQWLGVENAVVLLVVTALIFHFMLTRQPFGNRLYAVGNDEPSALSRGVDVVRVKTRAFVLCSMLAAFAGILTIADKPNTYVTMGFQYELEAIAAAVVGGCALTGGRGTILGAVLGSLIIVSVRYELISIGAPSSWFITFVGILLIAAVLFNRFIENWIRGVRPAAA
jgi:simple sugar transport system permease protein/ribose transport system permease protein